MINFVNYDFVKRRCEAAETTILVIHGPITIDLCSKILFLPVHKYASGQWFHHRYFRSQTMKQNIVSKIGYCLSVDITDMFFIK